MASTISAGTRQQSTECVKGLKSMLKNTSKLINWIQLKFYSGKGYHILLKFTENEMRYYWAQNILVLVLFYNYMV